MRFRFSKMVLLIISLFATGYAFYDLFNFNMLIDFIYARAHYESSIRNILVIKFQLRIF